MDQEFKKAYQELEKKHTLPSFSNLDDYFEVSRLELQGDKVLRDIRKVVIDKVVEYARLIEMLINPSNAPGMFAQFAKVLGLDDRRLLEKVYEKLVSLELQAIESDLGYNEKKEAELIMNVYTFWNSSLDDLKQIVGLMRRNFESKSVKRERSYFG